MVDFLLRMQAQAVPAETREIKVREGGREGNGGEGCERQERERERKREREKERERERERTGEKMGARYISLFPYVFFRPPSIPPSLHSSLPPALHNPQSRNCRRRRHRCGYPPSLPPSLPGFLDSLLLIPLRICS